MGKQFTATASRIINVQPSEVYKHVATVVCWDKWDPWLSSDATIDYTLSGPPAGVDACREWFSKKSGSGIMVITSAKENESLDIDLKFFKPFASQSTARFDFEPVAEGTKVTWTLHGESPLLMQLIPFVSMKKMCEKSFVKGLNSLAEVAEAS